MHNFIIISVILVAACVAAKQADKGIIACFKDKRVVGPCYTVHGKLVLGANMRPRLHPAGSKKLLGIVQKSDAVDLDYHWPPEVEKLLDYDIDVLGDFHVCPFTPDEPGKMRFVCINSVSNLKKRPVVLDK